MWLLHPTGWMRINLVRMPGERRCLTTEFLSLFARNIWKKSKSRAVDSVTGKRFKRSTQIQNCVLLSTFDLYQTSSLSLAGLIAAIVEVTLENFKSALTMYRTENQLIQWRNTLNDSFADISLRKFTRYKPCSFKSFHFRDQFVFIIPSFSTRQK